MNRLLIICGPTATGKTAVAVSLAKKFNGELISADSRQIYRGMDIGTGKDKESLQGIPICMYDIVDPDEAFSVSQYQKQARAHIGDIQKQNKLPIIVGGTGLYIKSLIETIPTSEIKPNEELRKKLEKLDINELQVIVKQEYPCVWGKLNASDRQNPRRLVRRIELAKAGVTILTKPSSHPNDVLWIGLTAPFPHLYERIDRRVDERVGQGITHEVRTLLQKGYSWNLPSMSGLGYRQWKKYIEGSETMEEAVQKWKFEEHGYARRQMTWFKRNKNIRWVDISKKGYTQEIESFVRTWYTERQ